MRRIERVGLVNLVSVYKRVLVLVLVLDWT